MTLHTLERPEQAPASGRASDPAENATANGSKRGLAVPILLQILAMIGIGALVYSSAADWFSTLNHNAEISGYTDSVDVLTGAERAEALDIARDYNAHMPQGVLRDPYTAPQDAAQNEAYSLYTDILRVSDNGVIGQLSYPRLGIGLPVYHGTSEDVLRKGVGHLYGSSLPVGGPSTHSVLTSHSGLLNASLFTPLPKAELGDTFTVQVLGETHWYRVDHIETILPEQTERLQIVNDQDLVTLITCTPIGINSHRLLVQGTRIDAPASDGRQAIAGDGSSAGFPWWVVAFIGGSALTAYLLFAPRRRGAAPSRGKLGKRGQAGPPHAAHQQTGGAR